MYTNVPYVVMTVDEDEMLDNKAPKENFRFETASALLETVFVLRWITQILRGRKKVQKKMW